MKKRKILLGLMALSSLVALTSCNSKGGANTEIPTNDNGYSEELKNIYSLYSANALANGETPKSYDDWLASIKGETGAQGPKGDKGDTGETGAQGPKGDKGDTGEAGAQGPKGDKGDTGEAGAQGPKGDKGDTGEAGAQGPKGDKGDAGEAGAQGPKGDKGDTGVGISDITSETIDDGYGSVYIRFTFTLTNGEKKYTEVTLSQKRIVKISLENTNIALNTNLDDLILNIYFEDGTISRTKLTREKILNYDDIDMSTVGNKELIINVKDNEYHLNFDVYDPSIVEVKNISLEYSNYLFLMQNGKISYEGYYANVGYSNGEMNIVPLSDLNISYKEIKAGTYNELYCSYENYTATFKVLVVDSLEKNVPNMIYCNKEIRIQKGNKLSDLNLYLTAECTNDEKEIYYYPIKLTDDIIYDYETNKLLDTSKEGQYQIYVVFLGNKFTLNTYIEVLGEETISNVYPSFSNLNITCGKDIDETKKNIIDELIQRQINVRYSSGREEQINITNDMISFDEFKNEIGSSVTVRINYLGFGCAINCNLTPDFSQAKEIATYKASESLPFLNYNKNVILYDNGYLTNGETILSYKLSNNLIFIDFQGATLVYEIINNVITDVNLDQNNLIKTYMPSGDDTSKVFQKMEIYKNGLVVLYNSENGGKNYMVFSYEYNDTLTSLEIAGATFVLDNETNTFIFNQNQSSTN